METQGPFWPLPDNYDKLSREEQRLERLKIVCDRSTPEKDVLAWDFFRRYYLSYEEAGWFDKYSDPAPDHYDWVLQAATHDRVVLAAHRGSAKSTIFQELVIRDLLTVPRTKQMIVMMTVEKAKKFVRRLRRQLAHNPRIKEDFGELKPSRNDDEGSWTLSDIELLNGSILQISSVTSTSLRGERPHCITLDDPEYDLLENTNIDRVVENMHTLVFTVLIPMLRRGCKFRWIGTPIHVRLFLWRIITGENLDASLDPTHWFRKIYPGLKDPYDDTTAFWPAEYPPEHVARIRKEWRNFGAEFLCRPGSDEERSLVIKPEINGYALTGDDPALDEHPLDSNAVLSFSDCVMENSGMVKAIPRVEPASSVFKAMTRFVTIDGIRVPGPNSDYAVIHVMGVDKYNQVFSLDMWSGKVRYSQLCNVLMEKFVPKWLPKIIGVEAYGLEMELLAQVQDALPQFSGEHGWAPMVRRIEYEQGIEKSERIAGLEWRMRRGLVKLPLWRREPCGLKPETALAYKQLLDQIDIFTPSMAGMEHDDAVDTLAMCQQIVKGPRSRLDTNTPKPSLVERLRNGETNIGGVPIALAFNVNDLPQVILDKYLNNDAPLKSTDPNSKIEWEESLA